MSVFDRLKNIRKHSGATQEDWASPNSHIFDKPLTGASYGRKEAGKEGGLGLLEIKRILDKTRIDARYLFEQMDSYEQARLDNPNRHPDSSELTELRTLLFESAKKRELSRGDDYIAERVNEDPELRECVQLLIENRGLVARVMGIVEGILDERRRTDPKKENSA